MSMLGCCLLKRLLGLLRGSKGEFPFFLMGEVLTLGLRQVPTSSGLALMGAKGLSVFLLALLMPFMYRSRSLGSDWQRGTVRSGKQPMRNLISVYYYSTAAPTTPFSFSPPSLTDLRVDHYGGQSGVIQKLLYEFGYYLLMQSQESVVRSWASSTEAKVRQFVDDYLINYPQLNVRRSTEKLLSCLYRKGTNEQRDNMFQLLVQRIAQLDSMGKSSEEFLSLLQGVLDLTPDSGRQRSTVLEAVHEKTLQLFGKLQAQKEYSFYSLCANMIDFGDEFKPYLLEANGCLRCFGRTEVEFEAATVSSLREEVRAHLNSVEWVLKRTYELRNLNVNFTKKKISYKSITIYYLDENGQKKELGRFGPTDPFPPFSLTTHTIGLTFEFAKPRRNHLSCAVCSSTDDYAIVCAQCIGKLLEMEASVKVVGGDADRISKELSEAQKSLRSMREQLEKFAGCVAEQTKAALLKNKIVAEMQGIYAGMVQNLRLLRCVSEEKLAEEKATYGHLRTDCYSCHFYEFHASLKFLLQTLCHHSLVLTAEQLYGLLSDYQTLYANNQVHAYRSVLCSILAQLYLRLQKTGSSLPPPPPSVPLMLTLLGHFKLTCPSAFEVLQRSLLEGQLALSVQQRVRLFVGLALDSEQNGLIYEEQLQPEKLVDVRRLSSEQFKRYSNLVNFVPSGVFDYPISNPIKLYLSLLPEELIPQSSLEIGDAAYLRFVKNVPPVISDETILPHVVLSPNPIIKLSMFRLLPHLIKLLPLESSMQVVRQLCRYRLLWNPYIRESVDCFDRMLQEVEKERKLTLSLQGYAASQESLYFEHIYRLLAPQRPNFIIRLQIPEKEMQKEEKNKGGPVEYIYLPVREVRSQQLKGDTMGALHEWITEQIRRMNQDMTFDLIVENNIVDNLDLSLEIVYRKIVQKETKRQIGSQVYHFFRVIYRIQGIFGEANERNAANLRDEQLEDSINFSSHLLTRLPLSKRTGLDVIMGLLPALDRSGAGRERRNKTIRMLEIIFKNESIIRKVVEWGYGNHILSLAVRFVSLQKQDLRSTELLLEMCSKVIDQANKEMVRIRKNSECQGRRGSEGEMEREGDETGEGSSQGAVRFVLQRVKQAEEGGFKHIAKKLIKILPFCSRDDLSASRYLFDFFEVANIANLKYSPKLPWFLEFIQALSESYSSFKAICRQEGVTDKVLQLVMVQLTSAEQLNEREQVEHLELALTLLKGLMQGDLELQDYLFKAGTLECAYRVGGVGAGGLSEEARNRLGKVPLVCFQMVKYLQEGKMISAQVQEHFQKSEEEKRKAIQVQKQQRKREILLKKQKVLNSFQHLIHSGEQELLTCSSCKEGYGRKKEVLGVYLYSSRLEVLSLEGWWRDSKRVAAVTSTSYFEPIHLDCHLEAMKDDLKIQKTEWDGALIRNSEVLCNNWIPFKGPDTPDEDYDKAARKYFEKNGKTQSFWLVLNDLNGLLEKFSKEYNFAHETKGSSHTHNAKLIPVLTSLTAHLLRNAEDSKYLREGVAFLEENPTKKSNLIALYFCVLLFLHNLNAFSAKRPYCLRLIEQVGFANFKDSKPLYVYLALVQSIMRLTHKAIPDGASVANALAASIPRNFNDLVQSFEIIAEEYKNTFLKWETVEQAKLYFQQ